MKLDKKLILNIENIEYKSEKTMTNSSIEDIKKKLAYARNLTDGSEDKDKIRAMRTEALNQEVEKLKPFETSRS